MRVVIFANGVMTEPAREVAAWIREGDLTVAADGGSSHALRAGITPRLVIGDCDSISDELLARLRDGGTRFKGASVDKDETDLELALLWAARQEGVDEIVVLGAFGGRPDQALANLLLLAHPALQRDTGRRVVMVDRTWEVSLMRGGEIGELRGRAGDRVSLIPLGGVAEGVTTTGLTFPLHEETLAFGPARGVSNRLEADAATVALRKGFLWCFHERRSAEAANVAEM
jgi:thiamine pyrophosphokinase